MKTLNPFSARFLRRGGILLALISTWFFMAYHAHAGLTFELHVVRFQAGQRYKFFTPLNTNATAQAATQGTYVIYSPQFLASTNGAFRAITIDSNGVNTVDGEEIPYTDFNSLMQQITNGTWSILFTNATTTNDYTFTISAPGVTSNMLPATAITYPANGSIDIPNQPTLTWQTPTGWPVPTTNTFLFNNDFSFLQFANLPAGQGSWMVPTPIPDGMVLNFDLSYATNNSPPVFTVTTPLNTN